jgi:hypothetical protein
MVIGVVVLFADQHSWGLGQTLDQLPWRQSLARTQILNPSQIGMRQAQWTLPGWQGRQSGLTARQEHQQGDGKDTQAVHSSTGDDKRVAALWMALHQHLQAEHGVQGLGAQHLLGAAQGM